MIDSDIKKNSRIAFFYDKNISYPEIAPFSPHKNYPEYPFGQKNLSKKNDVYDAVRKTLFYLELDKDNFDKPQWNPLGEIISPNQKIIIKPNLVRDYHGYGESTDSLITHGSIIRAVLDYVYIALKRRGEIIIGDAPLESADFNKLLRITRLNDIENFYQKNALIIPQIMDFRATKSWITQDYMVYQREKTGNNKKNYRVVNLGQESLFNEIAVKYRKYRVTNYDPREMISHQNRIKHEYLIHKSVLEADVVLNLPKIKTHRKAGITIALKSMVGINGYKFWLPHHMFGSKEEGGDEYLRKNVFKKLMSWCLDAGNSRENYFVKRIFHKLHQWFYWLACKFSDDKYFEGSWHGNDTIWRMILDLNRIAIYADKNGFLQDAPQRKFFILADGIIAGEKEGPMEPTAKKCGLIMAGFNSTAIDLTAAKFMGFDYKKIPAIYNVFKIKKYHIAHFRPADIVIQGNFKHENLNLHFIPPDSWRGQIEI